VSYYWNAPFIIDADLQDPPELFPTMIEFYLREQCNVVYGVRRARTGEKWFKKLSAKMFYRTLNYLADTPLPMDSGDFRLLDRAVIDAFNQLPEKNKYIRGLIPWLGYRQAPFFYEREARQAGVTKYSLRRMLKLAETGVFYFSRKPLNLAINLGFICLVSALILAFYTLLIKLSAPPGYVGGWASLMIVVIFFGGIQLLTIGILGKYIGNIFDEVKQRPEYIVADTINCD
jgi:polyisoprenyl-phosphate glycosyltransferase